MGYRKERMWCCRMEIERVKMAAEGDAANVRVKWTRAAAFEWLRRAFITSSNRNPISFSFCQMKTELLYTRLDICL